MGLKDKIKKLFGTSALQSAVKKQEEIVDYLIYEILTDDEKGRSYIKVTGLARDVEDVKIPLEMEGLPVEVIAKGAFKGNKVIKTVEVESNVRFIGVEAFMDCAELKNVKLPADLRRIRRSSFENCVSLEEIQLPYGLRRIGPKAFKNCTNVKSMYHRVKIGLGANPVLSKTLREENLPSGLKEIGAEAFSGCENIERAYIPYGVEVLEKNLYFGCKSLKEVGYHRLVKEIGEGVFAGCTNLKSVKLPPEIEKIYPDSFDGSCLVKYYQGCREEVLEVLKKGTCAEVSFAPISVDSKMIPGKVDGCFYSEEELDLALETYELRTPISEVIEREGDKQTVKVSRYDLEDGIYRYEDPAKKDFAKIVMVGDLMCRPKQIRGALKNGVYNFDQEFDHVRDLLSDSDLTIGNMETMVAKSVVYSDKASYIDDRVHLNAPEAWLNSVRKAGFDVVINSQNHAYDAGTRGVYETLNAQNQQQLIHTGIFASDNDKRYISLEVNGIKVAVISYFDQARQAMKRVNYTKRGLDVVYSNFYDEQIRKDIEGAKKEGAEFIIAYCHWGREYTHEITEKQAGLAKMVANAGADYLFGSHSHCLQPYDVVVTDDGREVPVVYSGGNFLSDMSTKMPIVRDTLICELELFRDENGKVQIKSEGYHPCLIRSDKENVRGEMYTVPIKKLLSGKCSKEEKIQLEKDILRIDGVVGRLPRFKRL